MMRLHASSLFLRTLRNDRPLVVELTDYAAKRSYIKQPSVADLLLGGREERVDQTENRTGADGMPEAEQRDAGQDPGDAGDGQTVDQGAEERVEEHDTEDASDGARQQVAHDGGAGEQREESDDSDEADGADEQRSEQAGAETAGERDEPKRGQHEHEQQDLDDESEHVCFSVFFEIPEPRNCS